MIKLSIINCNLKVQTMSIWFCVCYKDPLLNTSHTHYELSQTEKLLALIRNMIVNANIHCIRIKNRFSVEVRWPRLKTGIILFSAMCRIWLSKIKNPWYSLFFSKSWNKIDKCFWASPMCRRFYHQNRCKTYRWTIWQQWNMNHLLTREVSPPNLLSTGSTTHGTSVRNSG